MLTILIVAPESLSVEEACQIVYDQPQLRLFDLPLGVARQVEILGVYSPEDDLVELCSSFKPKLLYLIANDLFWYARFLARWEQSLCKDETAVVLLANEEVISYIHPAGENADGKIWEPGQSWVDYCLPESSSGSPIITDE